MKKVFKNKRKLVILLLVLIVSLIYILVDFVFFKPTKVNFFIASKIYEAPANSAFTDENLYKCIVDAYNEENNASVAYTESLTDEQLSSIEGLTCNNYGKVDSLKIADTSGIEKLTSLEYLHLQNNLITSIDLSNNKNLTGLTLTNNFLETIDLGNNLELGSVSIDNNKLISIDLSNNTKITYLKLSYNQLTTVKTNNNLEWLELDSNLLTTLDVSNYTSLNNLGVSNNSLSMLELENTPSLVYLTANDNQLTSLDVSSCVKLSRLHCSSNLLTSVDITNNPSLTSVWLDDNQLETLDTSKNESLDYLRLGINKLTTLDLSNNTKLTILDVHINNLQKLNLENNTLLSQLSCSTNQLTELNVSGLTSLFHISAASNGLTSVDVSDKPKLKYLDLGSNNLTDINLENNPVLENLEISNNKLVELDTSNNKEIIYITAEFNELVTVNVNNNSKLKVLLLDNNKLENLSIENTPSLVRFEVSNNNLTSLDLSQNSNIVQLAIYNNKLESLNFGDSTSINGLSAYDNNLKELTIPSAPNLTSIDVDDNQLESLIIVDAPLVTNIDVDNNKLVSLDLSNLPLLEIIRCQKNLLTSLDVSNNLELTYLDGYQNKLTKLNLGNITKLKTLQVQDNELESIDLSNNENLTALFISGNKLKTLDLSKNNKVALLNARLDNPYATSRAVYVGDTIEILPIVILPEENTYEVLNSISTAIDSYNYVKIDENGLVTAKKAGTAEIVNTRRISYTYGTTTATKQISKETTTLNIIEAVSDKYDINLENGYIYTIMDTDKETILSNISVNIGELEISDNKLLITYEDELVKQFDIVNISSDIYDLSKDYIFGYDEGNILVTNAVINNNIESNTLEIKYNDIVIDSYKIVEVSSDTYDLFNTTIKVNENTINEFIDKFNCINCEVKIYDGVNYLTEGEFTENNTLGIMYGDEVLKEYNLTFPVNGISLNEESIRLGLKNKNTVQLEAVVSPKNAENKNVSWTSSNEDVAIVDDNGLVTSVGLGNAIITVTTEEGGFTDAIDVEVVELITYKITYKDGDNTYVEEYEEAEEVKLKTLTKDGYTLVGWLLDDSEYKLDEVLTMPNEDIELVSKWEPNKYEITYQVNGGKLENESFEVIYDSTYGALEVPSKKGYIFKGWYLEEVFETEVTEDTIVKAPSNHTLYAKWEINSYKLTINPNGGIYNGDTELTINYNDQLEISDPTRLGYTFIEWKITGTESTIENSKFTMGISDSLVEAVWELIIPNIEETSDYIIKDNLIAGISLGSNLSDINLGLENFYTVKICNKSDIEKTSGLIATGDKVKIYLDDVLVSSYIFVVKGDVTGTGTSTVSDVAKLYQYLKKKIDMEDCYIEAGNVVDSDNEIKINDVAKLYQFIKKKIGSLGD